MESIRFNAMAIAMHTLTIFLAVPDAQDVNIFFQ
jgi:hypothetical protein